LSLETPILTRHPAVYGGLIYRPLNETLKAQSAHWCFSNPHMQVMYLVENKFAAF
jgi:hypothetical protein